MKRLRVLVLLHPDLVPPDSLKGFSEHDINQWKTEYDVVSTLRAVGSERQLRMEFIVLLTAKTVHSLYSPSRRQWLAL